MQMIKQEFKSKQVNRIDESIIKKRERGKSFLPTATKVFNYLSYLLLVALLEVNKRAFKGFK